LIVGNIFVGDRYVEPQGPSEIKCEQTGDSAHIQFYERSMFSKDSDINTVMAVIKDKDGKECFRVTGNYMK